MVCIDYVIYLNSFTWINNTDAFSLTCTIDETGGVVDATPESMGHNIWLSAKMTLNARINMF